MTAIYHEQKIKFAPQIISIWKATWNKISLGYKKFSQTTTCITNLACVVCNFVHIEIGFSILLGNMPLKSLFNKS